MKYTWDKQAELQGENIDIRMLQIVDNYRCNIKN